MTSCSVIIQGEGKGHFSQALSFIKAAGEKQIRINRIFLGRNFFRKTPAYFIEELSNTGIPFHQFYSPNFIRTPDKKGIQIVLSLLINVLLGISYLTEVIRIRILSARDSSSTILNFYDPLGALAFRSFSRGIERISISHHFYLAHPDFIHPHGLERGYFWLAIMNRFMLRSSDRAIALSFRKGDSFEKIEVFPPLLDPEILGKEYVIEAGSGDLGYLLNEGFLQEVIGYYREEKSRSAELFSDLELSLNLPVNVRVKKASRRDLFNSLQHSQRVISTAGFDLVAEAFYLGIPVFLIPTENHYEQYCNALDAVRTGMAFQLDNISELRGAELDLRSNKKFREWVSSLKVEMLIKQEQEQE